MVDLNNCRLCQDKCGTITLRDNSKLIDDIFICTEVEISLDEDEDKWPLKICYECDSFIHLHREFKDYVKDVDSNMRKLIQETTQNEVVKEVVFLQSGDDLQENGDIVLEFLDIQDDGWDESEELKNNFECSRCGNMYTIFADDNTNQNNSEGRYCNHCNIVLNEVQVDVPYDGQIKLIHSNSTVKLQHDDRNSSREVTCSPQNLLKDIEKEFEQNLDEQGQPANEINEQDIIEPKKKTVKYLQCTKCPDVFSKRDVLMKHMKSHQGSFVCKYENCKKVCQSEYALKYHHTKHNQNKRVLCKTCGKSFLYPNYLKYHELTHTGKKQEKCKECGKEFYKKCQLNLHVRTHHEGLKYYCSICPKSFVTAMNLQRHEIVHSGVRQFTCDVCSYQFFTEKELVRHTRRNHMNEKRHVCEYCAKAFFEKTQYRIHLRTHTGERPYVCTNEGCSKAYYERSHLKAHQKGCNKRTNSLKHQAIVLVLEEPSTS